MKTIMGRLAAGCAFALTLSLPAASTASLDPVWIKVAAAGSSAAAKANADFVCKGTNDQIILQAALDRCKMEERDLFLFNGVYMIDAFSERADKGPRAAVCIPNMKRYFVMKGQSFFQAGWNTSPSNGVILYARSSIWPTAGDDVPSVLRGEWTRNGIGSMQGGGLD